MGRRVETCYETNAGFEYDPYGRIIRMDGATDKIPFRYQSKWDMDYGTEATSQFSWGLVDYGLRFYQPKHGRFINRDPIGEAGGLNLYEAFGGDPLNRWDFLGLKMKGTFDEYRRFGFEKGKEPESDYVYELPPYYVRGDSEDFVGMPIPVADGPGMISRSFSDLFGFRPGAGEVGSITFNDNWRATYQEREGKVYITDIEEVEGESSSNRASRYNGNSPNFVFEERIGYPPMAGPLRALRATGTAIKSWFSRSAARGKVPLELGLQGKHIPSHNNYIPGRSPLTHNNPQRLLDDFAGKGQPVGNVPRGQPGFKERVDFGQVIGEVNGQPTTKGIIHYSKNGAHIVPANP